MLVIVALLPILLGIAVYPIGRKSQSAGHVFTLCAMMVQFVLTLSTVIVCYGNMMEFTLPWWKLSFTMSGVHGLGFRGLYLLVLNFMWLVAAVFSPEYFREDTRTHRYYSFMLVTLGGTCGMFLAADLMTLFTFFEIMSLSSYVWVVHTETDEARRASTSYLAVAVLGGMVALYGIMLLQHHLGTLELSQLASAIAQSDISRKTLMVSVGCLLFGFGAKAGMFPLHFWLPKSHPVAPAPASALLSGALTKAGLLGVILVCFRILPGDDVLGYIILALGTITMVLGAVRALFSMNIKEVLACSSMSQIGFVLLGLGMQQLIDPAMGGADGPVVSLGVSGAVLHMLNHSLFKLILFLCAGVCYKCCHSLDLNDLRGFGRNKPWLMAVFLSGALGITGMPLFSGYVSKTMLHEAIVEYAVHSDMPLLFKSLEWTFLLSGGMTVAYMTKLFVAIFVEKPVRPEYEENTPCASLATRIMLAVPALAVFAMGAFPRKIMESLATAVTMSSPLSYNRRLLEYPHYFTWECLSGAGISFAVGILIYLALVRKGLMTNGEYKDRWPKWLDIENGLYRPLCKACTALLKNLSLTTAKLPDLLIKLLSPRESHKEYGEYVRYKMAILVGRIQDKLHPQEESHVPAAIEMEKDLSWTHQVIMDSFSFALLMACIGVAAILVYVLWSLLKV